MKKFLIRIYVYFWIHVYDVKWSILHPFQFLYQTRLCSRIRVWWSFLYIRKDEFHSSLNMDGVAMLKMSKEERLKYLSELTRRRQLAHERGLD